MKKVPSIKHIQKELKYLVEQCGFTYEEAVEDAFHDLLDNIKDLQKIIDIQTKRISTLESKLEKAVLK